MIEEAYCGFEVSKLLKEKGFDEECFSYYHIYSCDDFPTEDEYRYESSQYEAVWDGTSFYNHLSKYRVGRCTHQLSMAWLREKYHIHISVNPIAGKGYIATIYDVADFDDYGIIADTKSYLHPEEAVEAALKYVLENLI